MWFACGKTGILILCLLCEWNPIYLHIYGRYETKNKILKTSDMNITNVSTLLATIFVYIVLVVV
jgi:hypothetical protein